ncbi:histidine--tRNA ligase [Candidatus Profftella armatura]|uniref:Histidine--tRNA ligase n=1 Tax=Candidatus Profftella armatura TaxID=669502 RepID=S5R856_9PROT|nr:histidine--tRNA ligase [Candidatus Profftella armatura]AGS06785.1 histidyl-tRNA synthetase [Candidatus Profftella armatura]ALC95896.1 histidyl-tRNA synthase [Candidatus Profftella armatura]QLK13697.1 histidine--tRNA ligase [Candidatus Profftella armatura]
MFKKNNKMYRIRGMNDILPIDSELWEFLENKIFFLFKSYGFQQIRTPILEFTSLFIHSLGEETDIVKKEMYSFIDELNGDNLSLRPEGTASVIRSVIENNLIYDGPKRLWYSGPMFRHERPQYGRYRQFYQIGVEAIGFPGPDIDAELIIMCSRLWKNLNLKNICLELNSIGNFNERKKYCIDLINYIKKHKDSKWFCEDIKHSLYLNSLRVLDSKNLIIREILINAPKLLDYLEKDSLDHFYGIQKILNYNNISYKINTKLVRGMDYYNRTVFEWTTDKLGSQNSICGGGRYDFLIKKFSNKFVPASGFAIGIERLIELIKKININHNFSHQCDIYIVHVGKEAELKAFVLSENLRTLGLKVILNCVFNNIHESFKSQMKRANASNANFAAIIGENEIINNTLIIKDLRNKYEDPTLKQISISFKDAENYFYKKIIKNINN